jgi:hypothetical protein
LAWVLTTVWHPCTIMAAGTGPSASEGHITIFLADDSVIVREGVRALLALEPDFELV